MALNGPRSNMSLGLLKIPLLVFGLPNLSLSTLAANERLIEIKIWQTPVSVDV
jgi:hypothetical protein